MDSDDRGYITKDQFIAFFKKHNKSINGDEEFFKPSVEVEEINDEIKEFYKDNNLNQAELNQKYEKYLESIEIDPNRDYFFPGNPTVLNNKYSALKKAHEFFKEKNTQSRGYWSDPYFGPHSQDILGLEAMNFDMQKLVNVIGVGGDPRSTQEFYKHLDRYGLQFAWVRIVDILQNQKGVFVDGYDDPIAQVAQGGLGDCWFIGALSLIPTIRKLLIGDFDLKNFDASKDLSNEEVKNLMIIFGR